MFDNMFRCPPEFEQMLVDYANEHVALREQFEKDLSSTGRIGPWLERSADNPEKYVRGDAQAAWEMYQAGASRAYGPEAVIAAATKLIAKWSVQIDDKNNGRHTAAWAQLRICRDELAAVLNDSTGGKQ